MNIEKLMKFMGYGAAHPEFDEFLHENGVKKRPKGDESTAWITDATKTITMEFSVSSTYNEEHKEPAKSEGWFVLRAIDVDSKCIEKIPLGIKFEHSKSQVDAILHPPIETAGDLIATYFSGGIVLTVRFARGGVKISSIGMHEPDIYDKKTLVFNP